VRVLTRPTSDCGKRPDSANLVDNSNSNGNVGIKLSSANTARNPIDFDQTTTISTLFDGEIAVNATNVEILLCLSTRADPGLAEWVGFGEGVSPSPNGDGSGDGAVPLLRIFFEFLSQNGAFLHVHSAICSSNFGVRECLT